MDEYVDFMVEQRYRIPYSFIEAKIGPDDYGSVWAQEARQVIYNMSEEELAQFNVDGEVYLEL